MSSNLPPGVTGREPQIAGPDAAHTLHMACDNDGDFVPVHLVTLMTRSFSERVTRLVTTGIVSLNSIPNWAAEWEAILAEHTITTGCEWEGTVEVEFQDRVAFWTCPRCGCQHEDPELADSMREDALLERAERERDL